EVRADEGDVLPSDRMKAHDQLDVVGHGWSPSCYFDIPDPVIAGAVLRIVAVRAVHVEDPAPPVQQPDRPAGRVELAGQGGQVDPDGAWVELISLARPGGISIITSNSMRCGRRSRPGGGRVTSGGGW